MTAHGEGRAVFEPMPDQADGDRRAAVSSTIAGAPTEIYPLNPNGSPGGLTAVTTADGRFTVVDAAPGARVPHACSCRGIPTAGAKTVPGCACSATRGALSGDAPRARPCEHPPQPRLAAIPLALRVESTSPPVLAGTGCETPFIDPLPGMHGRWRMCDGPPVHPEGWWGSVGGGVSGLRFACKDCSESQPVYEAPAAVVAFGKSIGDISVGGEQRQNVSWNTWSVGVGVTFY